MSEKLLKERTPDALREVAGSTPALLSTCRMAGISSLIIAAGPERQRSPREFRRKSVGQAYGPPGVVAPGGVRKEMEYAERTLETYGNSRIPLPV